jgi:uncharacterized protein (DUF58 family)
MSPAANRSLTPLIPRWHLRITNFGLGYILMTLLVAIAATNTANNGLYTVLAGLLGGMIVSGVVSRRNLRAVKCTVEPSGEIFAGRPAWIAVTVRNGSAALTAQGVWFLHEALPGPLYIAPLSPGAERRYALEATFPRRGVFSGGDAGLMSRFPAGLFRKYRSVTWPHPLVVYPDPLRSARREETGESPTGTASSVRRRGFGPEVRTLRDFVSGDDVRDLHWKQSARLGKWIVRERQDERSRRVVFEVNNVVADPLDPGAVAAVERAIAATAGEALALIEGGGEAGLAARGASISPAGGAGQRRRILEALARLEIHDSGSAPPFPAPRPGETRRQAAA